MGQQGSTDRQRSRRASSRALAIITLVVIGSGCTAGMNLFGWGVNTSSQIGDGTAARPPPSATIEPAEPTVITTVETPAARRPATGPRPLPEPTPADLDEFLAALDPLAGIGKLGALLVQFPAGFRADPESRDYLARHGCVAYQGYFFGRPLPLAEFERLLEQS